MPRRCGSRYPTGADRMVRLSRQYSSSLARACGALVALAASTASVTPAGAATSPTPVVGSRTITSNGVSLQMPATWPVYDLGQQTGRCAGFDVHAVYLGHQGSDASCPAHLLGKTDAVRIEPLD